MTNGNNAPLCTRWMVVRGDGQAVSDAYENKADAEDERQGCDEDVPEDRPYSVVGVYCYTQPPASEPCDGPQRAFLEMPEGYSGPVKVSNPGAPVAEVTVYPSQDGASRDASSNEFPECKDEPRDCPYIYCHSQLKCAKAPAQRTGE